MSVRHKISRSFSIQVVRRKLVAPRPGSAEPRHEYTPVFTVRSDVKTRSGATEFSRVDINGKAATHTFSIRYTTIPFDVRDRVRSADGSLYQILSVENVDNNDRELRIHCSNQGDETVEAAR